MKRNTFNLLAACVWIVLFVLVFVFWDLVVAFGERWLSELGQYAVPGLLCSLAIVGLYVQAKLAERFAPKVVIPKEDLTVAERRQRAIREAAAAIKQGKPTAAIAIYEEAGMLNEALRLAHSCGDRVSLARLSFRLGLYSRARHLYLQLKDYEAAANTSLLMEEVAAAREHYKQAAEACKGKVPEVVEAALWERAGDRAAAAALYEKGLDLERASECYLLLGDKKNSVRCADQAKAMQAFEDKQRGESRELRERRTELDRSKAVAQAKELKVKGDLLGAGIMFRKAGQHLEAAMAFERFEEWERAAEAYEKAGLKDRADLARMHIEVKPTEEEGVIPSPSSVLATPFTPIERARAVPVYLGITGMPPSSPEVRREICKRVRRGNFPEAAEFAKAAGDWVMAAAYYEHAGNHLGAADVYRQIGDVNAAAWCLEKAGRPRDAAFLALGIGRKEYAVKALLNAIESGKDVKENGMSLINLLAQWGKRSQALDLFRKKIVPEGVTETNAETYYQVACEFEDQKAYAQALALYRDLIAAGAESPELTRREAGVVKKLADSQLFEGEPTPAPGEADQIDSMLTAALQELAEPAAPQAAPTPEKPLEKEVVRFTFRPKAPAEAPAGAEAAGRKTLVLAGTEVSLFGRAVGDPKPFYSFDDNGDLLIEEAELGEEQADPFTARHRYKIKSELGRGGMGVVYEAVDGVLGRRVALKLILEESANPDAFEQFLVEARAVALLSHPNVVTIYDIGLMDMRHYIAMEFVDGGSLASLVRKEKVLPFKEALRLFIEISRGLQTAHEAGVVHRDIKPENILLTEKRIVKISDFGLAKVKKAKEEAEKTKYESSGTLGFMPLEQVYGEEPHPVFDIYALGITLFTMLVGKPPHETLNKGSLLEVLEFQKSGEYVPIKRFRMNVPDSIEQVYRYCAAADPAERYQSIDAFLPAVEKIYGTM